MPNTFVQTRQGSETHVYVMSPWESSTLISAAIADGGETDLVSRTGDLITIACANGTATYGLSGYDKASGTYFADLVRSTFQEPPALVRKGMN